MKEKKISKVDEEKKLRLIDTHSSFSSLLNSLTSILQLRHCQRTRAHTRVPDLQNKTIWMQNQVIVYQSQVGCYQNNGKWQTSRWKTKTPFILMRQDGRKEKERKRRWKAKKNANDFNATWLYFMKVNLNQSIDIYKKERLNKPLYIRTHGNTHAHNMWRESSLFFLFFFLYHCMQQYLPLRVIYWILFFSLKRQRLPVTASEHASMVVFQLSWRHCR